MPTAILDDTAAACLTRQMTLERQLDAFLPDIIRVGETQHMRHDFAAGVITAIFVALVDTRDAKLRHALGDRGRKLAFGIYEIAFGIGEPLLHFLTRHV